MIITIYLTYLGMLLFSFSLDKHYKVVTGKNANRYSKIFSKLFGTISLVVALSLSIQNIGISLGITYWVGILAIATFVIALIYTYQAKILIKLSVLLLLISLILTII